jgi:hypothetical protein
MPASGAQAYGATRRRWLQGLQMQRQWLEQLPELRAAEVEAAAEAAVVAEAAAATPAAVAAAAAAVAATAAAGDVPDCARSAFSGAYYQRHQAGIGVLGTHRGGTRVWLAAPSWFVVCGRPHTS